MINDFTYLLASFFQLGMESTSLHENSQRGESPQAIARPSGGQSAEGVMNIQSMSTRFLSASNGCTIE